MSDEDNATFDYEFDDDIIRHVTTREWAFTKDDNGSFVWYGYGRVMIHLDWDSFLHNYIYRDASKKLRESWGSAPQWYPMASITIGMEMRVTQDALGFRCPENYSTRWLWRDDLIRWVAGGAFPGLSRFSPETGEPDVIRVTIGDDDRFHFRAMVPTNSKLKLAPDVCAETPRPWPRPDEQQPRWAAKARPQPEPKPKGRAEIKAWGPAKLKF